jgi:NAD(P)-dependent dehydrogenase (short-subunit alcohol dehydrogenase family)
MALHDRVAVITGGASGIGRASARLFTEQGARVYVLDLDQQRLDEVVAAGEAVKGVTLDISNSSEVTARINEIAEAEGRLDILVNGAGINAPTAKANQALVDANIATLAAIRKGEVTRHEFIETTTDEEFQRVLEVNLFSQFYCLRAAVPHMKATGGGAIVNISSAAALAGVVMPLYYPASKAGVLGMTRAAAAELAGFNIRVNAIAPGGVDTPLMHQQPKEVVEFLIGMQPIRRLAQPEELAQTVLFLADDSTSGFYTGQTISPNGGLIM